MVSTTIPKDCWHSWLELLLQITSYTYWTNTRCGRKVMRLIFYFPKFLFFSNINVIPFKIVPLGSYTPMETLFPLLVAALEVFNRYGLQHVCSTYILCHHIVRIDYIDPYHPLPSAGLSTSEFSSWDLHEVHYYPDDIRGDIWI